MEPIASFSGLASGIDFQSLVEQIIQVESRPVQRYQSQISQAQARSAAWSTFRGKVQALQTQASELACGRGVPVFHYVRLLPELGGRGLH